MSVFERQDFTLQCDTIVPLRYLMSKQGLRNEAPAFHPSSNVQNLKSERTLCATDQRIKFEKKFEMGVRPD